MPSQPNPTIAPLLASAVTFLKSGRPGEAIAPLQTAAAMDPANASVQHDLGLACLEVGRLAEAVAALEAAISVEPRYVDAYFRMGIALEALGDAAGAVRAYDRATELRPSLAEAWFRAGALVFTMGHWEEAAGCFRRAAAAGGKTAWGRLGAARAWLAENRYTEAERGLRQLLARDPRNALALDTLGNLLSETGRFEEARACFAQAIMAAPSLAGSYYELVRCRPLGAEDSALLPEMEQALKSPGLTAEQAVRVHLAIGKAADDFGDHGRAMQHFDAADAIRSRLTAFDGDAFEARIDRIMADLADERIAKDAAGGSADATPILIIGMPRSGTTLLEQILSRHPAIGAGGELDFWPRRGLAWLASGAGVSQATGLRAMAEEYLRVLRHSAPGSQRVTDKMPFNFVWAGLIHITFPRALIVHCRRAAIDTALSIHGTYFNPHVPFPTGGPALVRYFDSYRRITDHWRRVLPPGRFVDIDYEALVLSPEAVVRELVARAGLDWDPACLEPERNSGAVRTASKWQARQPIYRHAVQRWRRYEPWLGALAPLLGDRGYVTGALHEPSRTEAKQGGDEN